MLVKLQNTFMTFLKWALEFRRMLCSRISCVLGSSLTPIIHLTLKSECTTYLSSFRNTAQTTAAAMQNIARKISLTSMVLLEHVILKENNWIKRESLQQPRHRPVPSHILKLTRCSQPKSFSSASCSGQIQVALFSQLQHQPFSGLH